MNCNRKVKKVVIPFYMVDCLKRYGNTVVKPSLMNDYAQFEIEEALKQLVGVPCEIYENGESVVAAILR